MHRFSLSTLVGALALAGGFLSFAAGAADARTLRLVAIGDSLVDGYMLNEGQGFVPRLQVALRNSGYDVVVGDEGIFGEKASGGLRHLDSIIRAGADAVILELGANDMLRGVDPGTTYSALDQMLTKLEQAHIPVLLTGMIAAPDGMFMFVPHRGQAYIDQFNGIYATLAARHPVIFYPFFLDARRPTARCSFGITSIRTPPAFRRSSGGCCRACRSS